MALCFMYITNNPQVALVAEKTGVDRIWVDLETLGKEERQKNLNTVKSKHSIDDVKILSKLLTKSELMVRVNPINSNSKSEIEEVIKAGAGRIMLPMWKTFEEAKWFLDAVGGRVKTTLLLETKEAVGYVDEVLSHPLIDEIHIGLNDLHLSYGLKFMFELLSNGTVEKLCEKFKKKGIAFGFGGIARLGQGMLPAERIITEHYRLGSTRAILSRSFCNAEEVQDIQEIEHIFRTNILEIREYEKKLSSFTKQQYAENLRMIVECVQKIVKDR